MFEFLYIVYIPVALVESNKRGTGFDPAAITVLTPDAGVVVPINTEGAAPEVAKNAESFVDNTVVEAYGKVDEVEVVAVKYAATTRPSTESFAYGDDVPIPMFPELVAIKAKVEPLLPTSSLI